MENNLLGLLSPHQRMRMGQMLMAGQYDRPTPHDTMPTQRANLLPLATYENGMTGPALPGLLAQPLESFNKLLKYGYTPGTGDTAAVEAAFDAAGGALMGGSMVPKPRGSLGVNRLTIDYFGKPVTVLDSPSPRETAGFINRTKYKAARRIIDPDTGATYIWDAADPALHEMMAKHLGVDPKKMQADMIGID